MSSTPPACAPTARSGAWGYNGNGQLGQGDFVNRLTPVRVGTATKWQSVSAGWGHTVALRTDGTLWAWGANAWGQLGDGTTTPRNVPQQVGSATWSSVVAG